MTDDFDFYDLLEIEEDAPPDAVKDAFREKVQEYHPDLNDDPDAPAQFTAVNKAYEILQDPAERQAYDRLGHKDYVAKRTSGIPDPDAWRTDEESTSTTRTGGRGTGSSGTSRSRSASSRAQSATSSSDSAGRGGSSSTGSTSESRSRGESRRSRSSSSGSSSDRSRSSSNRSKRASSTESAAGGGSTSNRRSNRRATTASSTAAGSGTSTAAGSGTTTAAGSGGSAAAGSGASTGSTVGTRGTGGAGWTENALFEWWRALSLGWPLMLASTVLFVVGVAHWVSANVASFRSFWAALQAAGTESPALREAVVSRHGIPTLYEFVLGTNLVAQPLPTRQWYGALAAIVVVPIVAFAVYRAVWAARPTKWVTVNETVGVGVATAIAATLYGGPLLAGAVVMPFVFAVIVRHTRLATLEFNPTYAYVVGVTPPLAAIGAETALSSPPLALDVAAACIPILSVLALLFSAFVRPRLFG